jgi:hypothetical protein
MTRRYRHVHERHNVASRAVPFAVRDDADNLDVGMNIGAGALRDVQTDWIASSEDRCASLSLMMQTLGLVVPQLLAAGLGQFIEARLAVVAGRAAGRARRALPGTPAPGIARLDFCRLGDRSTGQPVSCIRRAVDKN